MPRGRKKNNDASPENKMYFGTEQENAIVAYLEETDEVKRNEIYNLHLKYPFEKMAESIINKYRLWSKVMSYEDLFHDTISFLHTKLDKFDKLNGAKAYSYYGTIIVRKLRYDRKKEDVSRNNTRLYEDVYRSVLRDDDIIEEEYVEDNTLVDFFYVIADEIKTMINNNTDIKENDLKVGEAILEIIENHKSIFEDTTIKFNKTFILECIRNITLLPTREITTSLKFYKKIYINKKREFLNKTEDDNIY